VVGRVWLGGFCGGLVDGAVGVWALVLSPLRFPGSIARGRFFFRLRFQWVEARLCGSAGFEVGWVGL